MNRGGLADATFEYDDRFTGYDAASVATSRLDGGKMLLRINLEDPATADTLERLCEARLRNLPGGQGRDGRAIHEPHASTGGQRATSRSRQSSARCRSPRRSVQPRPIPGSRSRWSTTWPRSLRLRPFRWFYSAASVPTAQTRCSSAGSGALALPGVRGLVIGRNLLYPKDDDVEAAVKTAASLL